MSDIIHKEEKQEVELTTDTPLLKQKKPRTQKQIEAFEVSRQKRSENIAKAKELKKIEASKILLAAIEDTKRL